MQDGDDKKGSQNEEKKRQFPCPIMWMPGYNKPEETVKDLKEVSNSPKVSEETPKFKIIPLKFLENGNGEEKAGVAEDEPKTRAQLDAVREKEAKIKTIPVKQMEASSQMKNEKQNEKSEEKKSGISEKQNEDCGVKKAFDGKQSSPVKSSKLAPVCLRVDPLPRRKNGNRTSRSPSPPGLIEKERSHQDHKEHGSTLKEAKEEIPEKEIRAVDGKDKTSIEVEKEAQSNEDAVPIISMKDAAGLAVPEKASELCEKRANEGWGSAEDSDSKGAERNDTAGGLSDGQEKKTEESRAMEDTEITRTEGRKEGKNLTESDAAVLIQSAYRGFEVRRWQPLEKLRKVARIRQQMEDIAKQIQSCETCSGGQDMKQKVVISETIMNLLLQLDTIQGLHQSVREARKSVARELICLQEKLDSLSGQTTADRELAKIEENASSKASDDQTCLASSVAVAEPSSEHLCEKVSDKKCTANFTSSEGMQEAEAEAKRDTLTATENQELEAVAGEAAHLLNKEMVSVTNGEHEEAPLRGEEQTVSEGAASIESKQLSEEPSLKLEECLLPLVSTVKKVLEVPSAKDEAPNLDLEEHLETRELICQELCDYGARPNTQVNLEAENSLVSSLKGCNLDEADEIKVEEHEAVSNAVVYVEPLQGIAESNFENKDPINEAGRKQEELQMLPLAAESDSMDKTAGDATADTNSVEVPSTLHITSAVDFVETVPGVGDSNSAKAPGSLLNEAETKEEEPRMLMVGEENYFAEKASGDAAAGNINMEAISAIPVTWASEESNDVGSMVEKNLKMTISGDQTAVQVRSTESGMENGTKLVAANEVIEDDDMPSAPESLQETTMDKDTTSSLKQIHHREASLMSVMEAARDEVSTPSPNEEGTDVAQPKDSIPMAGPVPSTNLSTEEKKLVEENEKLRDMLEKLLLAGKLQLGVISDLDGRVKDLEKKLTQKKRLRVRRQKPAKCNAGKVAC